MLMHLLSPYPAHRSAVTDCAKLAGSGFEGATAVLVYGYAYPDWPLEPAIEAFEALAGRGRRLGERAEARFEGLCHPVHRAGGAFAWEVSV